MKLMNNFNLISFITDWCILTGRTEIKVKYVRILFILNTMLIIGNIIHILINLYLNKSIFYLLPFQVIIPLLFIPIFIPLIANDEFRL